MGKPYALWALLKKIPGCETVYIGAMHYMLVTTPEFKKRYFGISDKKQNIPILQYDYNDALNDKYFSMFMPAMCDLLEGVLMPSVKGLRIWSVRLLCSYSLNNRRVRQSDLVCVYPDGICRYFLIIV